jgi:hypothetical protein
MVSISIALAKVSIKVRAIFAEKVTNLFGEGRRLY